MGSGKTTVGSRLAQNLSWDFVDTDDLIQNKVGMSIPQIFDTFGEIGFRELEIQTAKSLRERPNVVIATGGGMVINALCIQYLRENRGWVLYLSSSFENLKERVAQQDVARPLFKDIGTASRLYTFRTNLYREYATATINTDGIHIDMVVSQALSLYHTRMI